MTLLAGSSWLLVFVHAHSAFAIEPRWQLALHADASRAMRAVVGAIGLIALFAPYRLIRLLRPDALAPPGADIDRVRPIVERSVWTYANLVLRGDEALLFSKAGDAFLMYGRRGRSWIAMGDPIGLGSQGRLSLVQSWHGALIRARYAARRAAVALCWNLSRT